MTKEQLLAIIADLELEPSAQADLEVRINAEGATEALVQQVQEMIQEKIAVSQQQEELIQQALSEVAQTDAEVAKIVHEAEAELKGIEDETLKNIDTIMNEQPTADTAAPAH